MQDKIISLKVPDETLHDTALFYIAVESPHGPVLQVVGEMAHGAAGEPRLALEGYQYHGSGQTSGIRDLWTGRAGLYGPTGDMQGYSEDTSGCQKMQVDSQPSSAMCPEVRGGDPEKDTSRQAEGLSWLRIWLKPLTEPLSVPRE